LVPELLPSYLEELAAIEARRAELDAQVKAESATDIEGDEEPADGAETLAPAELAVLKKQLAAVKTQQKAMRYEFITKLGKARAELTAAEERGLVLRLAKNDVQAHLDGYASAHRQQIITAVENWWDKYAVPLHQIGAERAAATVKLASFLKELGYE
jgi:type I restriction enzyme M protein